MRKVALLLLLARLAHADPATGHLRGRVLDPAGTPLRGVTVVVEGAEVARSARSGDDGSFVIEDLLPGPYRIEARAEGRAPSTIAASIGAGEEASVSISVGPAAERREEVGYTRRGLLAGLPLWSRSAPAVLRLSLASRARAGAHPRFAAAHASPQWQLDGFEFTHPLTGGPAVVVGLEALAAAGAEEIGVSLWGTGPRAGMITLSGSNKYDFDATAIGRPVGQGAVDADAQGAVLKDRLWFALSGQAEARDDRGGSGRALSKLSFQPASRHRFHLVTALAGGHPGSRRAVFGGLAWEGLPSDNVVVGLRLSLLDDAGGGQVPPSATVTGQGRLDWYLASRATGDHDISLISSGSRTGVTGAAATRGQFRVEDQWHATRYATIGAAFAFTRARPLDGSGAVGGPAWLLSLAWDATHDGRTAARARVSTAAVPGVVAVACADCVRSTQVGEAALGLERHMGSGTFVTGAELLVRRARAGGATEREALAALHVTHHQRGYKLSAVYQGRVLPAPSSELLALASLGLTRWLSAGALALYAPRATWLPLFEEPAGPLTPAAGDSAWLLGLQLRAEVGNLVGLPAALWLDALNLTNDRGALATVGATPIQAPPFQLRVGLRVEY